MKEKQGQNDNPCYAIVKRLDPDRYFSALLADKQSQSAIMSIYAFAAEVAAVPSQVSEPPLGEIRLQWWQEEVEKLYSGKSTDHPVLSAVGPTIIRHDLPRHLFDKFIRATILDLYTTPVDSFQQLERHFDDKYGAIINLVTRVIDLDKALETSDLQEHAGRAIGYTYLLIQLPHHLHRGHTLIPLQLFSAHKTSLDKVLAAPETSRALTLIQAELDHKARQNLKFLYKEQFRLSKAVLNAFWPASMSELYLRRIKKRKYALARDRGHISQLRLQWFLLAKSIFEKL